MSAARRQAHSVFLDGWRMALGTITAIPVTPPSRIDGHVAGRAMMLAPLAALPLAGIWLLGAVVALPPMLPTWPIAAVTIAAIVLATRGMHLDGLADTCDGLSASYDREKAFAIMKTGDVGPSGAAAIALVLLIEVSATAFCYQLATPPALALGAVSVCASRAALAVACRRGVPSARPTGLGATVAGTVSLGALLLGLGGSTVVGGLLLWLVGAPAWAALPLVLVAAATAGLVVRHCTRRLGGINGDVLGASVEISAALALTTAACLAAFLV